MEARGRVGTGREPGEAAGEILASFSTCARKLGIVAAMETASGTSPATNTVVRKNFAYGRVDRFVVVVHGDEPPTDDVWKEYMDYTFSGANARDVVRHLVVTEGASPTSAQRKLLQERTADFLDADPMSVRAAIVTTSTFARGIVTAIGWIVDAPKAFAPDKLEDAMRYLGIPMNYYEPIKTMVATLQGELRKQKGQ
jgi:hypothetical protein